MGVDLGLWRMITTSSYYGYGDSCFRTAVDDFHEAEGWIADQIQRGSYWLLSRTRECNANIIALEDFQFNTSNLSLFQEIIITLSNEIKRLAEMNSLQVEVVNPQDTSILCSKCGHPGYRLNDKFSCARCNYTENADYNASRNIGIRYILKQALADLLRGEEPWEKYFLVELYGPTSIDDLGWIRPILMNTLQKRSGDGKSGIRPEDMNT